MNIEDLYIQYIYISFAEACTGVEKYEKYARSKNEANDPDPNPADPT